MTTIIEAVYEGGLFRPVGKVDLKEGTHVEVRVPRPAAHCDPRAVAARLDQLAAKTPCGPHPETTARDYDRILFGGKCQA
jgi:predicted DNA-binding antitoxin AbrB/MazE fold protein